MSEDPPFTFAGFIGGLAVGGFVAVALILLTFAFMTQVIHHESSARNLEAIAPPSLPTATLPSGPRTEAAQQVRAGPGLTHPILGTLGGNQTVFVVGRNARSEWIAIQFPPGSGALGWLPISGVLGIPNPGALALVDGVALAPTVISSAASRAKESPSPPGGSNSLVDLPTEVPASSTPLITPTPSNTPAVTVTPTVQPTRIPGPPDLAVQHVSRLSDGRIQAVIINKGEGNLSGFAVSVVVSDATTRSELLSGGVGLQSGASVTVESSSFTVTQPTMVTVTVDPAATVKDADRTNNSMSVALSPPTTPTPLPTEQLGN